MPPQRYRLTTRMDFDGIVCAALLKEQDLVREVCFAHPQDIQSGQLTFTDEDITANLPYAPGVHMAFDHHASETLRTENRDNHILDPEAPSAARLIYDYYGGTDAFPRISGKLMCAVDRVDAAELTAEDILDPQGWILAGFLMDTRTRL